MKAFRVRLLPSAAQTPRVGGIKLPLTLLAAFPPSECLKTCLKGQRLKHGKFLNNGLKAVSVFLQVLPLNVFFSVCATHFHFVRELTARKEQYNKNKIK